MPHPLRLLLLFHRHLPLHRYLLHPHPPLPSPPPPIPPGVGYHMFRVHGMNQYDVSVDPTIPKSRSCDSVCELYGSTCNEFDFSNVDIIESFQKAGISCEQVLPCQDCVDRGAPYIYYNVENICYNSTSVEITPCDQKPVDEKHRRLYCLSNHPSLATTVFTSFATTFSTTTSLAISLATSLAATSLAISLATSLAATSLVTPFLLIRISISTTCLALMKPISMTMMVKPLQNRSVTKSH